MSVLQFDFTVDKAAKTVFITKGFDVERSLVWDAFTRAEILDQWWAPKPLLSRTKFMDFRAGGRRFYAMVSPEGQEIGWQVFNFTSITPQSNFKCPSVFTDQDETPQLPSGSWDVTFSDSHEGTNLSISIRFESWEELEKMIELGFKEGFTITLNELGNLLKTLKK